uniref:Eukaryotic translation initiation factor 2 subunit 2 n=1 Tax=Phallusia mammillata TaxID=59560 RepID=A0A6F9DCB6_9ASCI|nr:IF5-1 translation initiation factor [Phallusia mammillata]
MNSEEIHAKATLPENDPLDELDLSNVKKKKKKKKTTYDVDAQATASKDIDPTDANEEDTNKVNENVSQVQAENNDLEDLDLGSKKKKKKVRIMEEDGENNKEPEDLDQLQLDKKKKKKKVVVDIGAEESLAEPTSWVGVDRDYTYDELLTRVFDIMRQKNPEMVAGEKKRFIMKPPQCARVGTKKTSFVNFTEICQTLHRQPKHILAFILAELGTSGSVDGNNQLIVKGRFQQKQLESVLRRYIKEYVTCHTCRSPDTILERDVRLHFLRCRVCQSRCSVATIKSGFQAVTGKRARIRAKAMS